MGRSGLFDLEKHFAFYGAYHSNPTNIFLHMLFVWPTVFSTSVLLYFTPSFFNLPDIQISAHGTLVMNIGFFLTVIYSLFYISLDKKAGSLAAFLCLGCWVSGSLVANRLGYSLAWKKRAPALLDNLAQALLMGPFFVLLEALQTLYGYEPYQGFRSSVQAKIDAQVQQFHDKKQKKFS